MASIPLEEYVLSAQFPLEGCIYGFCSLWITNRMIVSLWRTWKFWFFIALCFLKNLYGIKSIGTWSLKLCWNYFLFLCRRTSFFVGAIYSLPDVDGWTWKDGLFVVSTFSFSSYWLLNLNRWYICRSNKLFVRCSCIDFSIVHEHNGLCVCRRNIFFIIGCIDVLYEL